MSTEGNELTLEGLAQRLEALERENERMRSGSDKLPDQVEGAGTSGEEEGAAEFHGPASVGEQRDSRLALHKLTQRLGALERENASLRREVAALAGWRGEPAPEFGGPARRRSLLRRVGAAALGAAAAGGIRLARANAALDLVTCKRVQAQDNYSVAREGVVTARNIGGGTAVWGENEGNYPNESAIHGDGATGVSGIGHYYGLDGFAPSENENSIGVRGVSSYGTGVKGGAWRGTGVQGEGAPGVSGTASYDPGYGVVGDGIGSSHAGVLGRNSSGAGVKGEGTFAGVSGSSSMPGSFSNLPSGVYGEHTGQGGYGVRAVGDTGVWGQGHKGYGVRGQSASRFYAGVYGENTSTGILGGPGGGIGGQFKGGRAQVMLDPNDSSGSPETGEHSKGELFMDSAADLFVCVASSTATAGAKWKKVATTAV